MRITDYIPNFYFENVADRLKPDYPGMLYKFNDKNQLKMVMFKSLIDNNVYRVTYNYDNMNRIISERLVTLTSNNVLNLKPGTSVCIYNYAYSNSSNILEDPNKYIVITSYSDIVVRDGLYLINRNGCKSFYKKYLHNPGLLLKSIDMDDECNMVETVYKYGFNERLLSKTVTYISKQV